MILTEINQFLPWFVIVLQFIGFCWIILKQINVIHDNTLAKVPAKAPTIPPQIPSVPIFPESKPCPPIVAPTSPVHDVAIDQGLEDFVKKEEGFEPKAKWDYKQWTNGYGTRALNPNEVISEKEAEIRLRNEIAAADALVKKRFPNLTKGLHQALIDLTFNSGAGWEDHSLGAAVAANKIETVKADIQQYVHAGKPPVVLQDLVQRRAKEVAMIDNPL